MSWSLECTHTGDVISCSFQKTLRVSKCQSPDQPDESYHEDGEGCLSVATNRSVLIRS